MANRIDKFDNELQAAAIVLGVGQIGIHFCHARDALYAGVKFSRDESEEILEHIQERELSEWIESSID